MQKFYKSRLKQVGLKKNLARKSYRQALKNQMKTEVTEDMSMTEFLIRDAARSDQEALETLNEYLREFSDPQGDIGMVDFCVEFFFRHSNLPPSDKLAKGDLFRKELRYFLRSQKGSSED